MFGPRYVHARRPAPGPQPTITSFRGGKSWRFSWPYMAPLIGLLGWVALSAH